MAFVLINPRSFTVASDGLAERAIALAQTRGATVVGADSPAEIAIGVERAIDEGADRIVVLAGDGTVQAIVDHLAARPPGRPAPPLLLLGGGRSNLTAADLGAGGAVLERLEAALAAGAGEADGTFHVVYRQSLAVGQAPERLRHGFFVAGALVDRLIRRIHHYRLAGGRWRTGNAGTVWCVLKAMLPALRGSGDLASPFLDLDMPGQGRLRGPVRLLVATTLAHEEQRLDPYADRGEGALRVTAVAYRAKAFWRSLPRLLTGRFSPAMTPAQGYLSGRCASVSITGLDGYTIDGQSFDCDPARPLVIRSGPHIAFLRP